VRFAFVRWFPKREDELLALALSRAEPMPLPEHERRNGRDRRSGADRRVVDRPVRLERRSGVDRRGGERRQILTVLPPRPDDEEARRRVRDLLRRLTRDGEA
jgi:hypothetical protein